MYVDDIIGICMVHYLFQDLNLTRGICTRLLGSSAVADEKTEHGTRLDFIGYVVDLTTRRVSIARKNILNTVYGFLSIDTSVPMTVKSAQRLASWASRYGKICRAKRPFASSLHRLSTGRTDLHATFLPSL